LRVIAGRKGGLVLDGAGGKDFRPTTQLAKGAIFNSLYGEVQGSVILDLFAGSGGLGIEGLSRGAKKAVFVENDGRAVKVLKENLAKCGFERDEAVVFKIDAIRFLKREIEKKRKYDIIVADPPYSGDMAQQVIDLLSRFGEEFCRILILEADRELKEVPESSLERYKVRNFGQTRLNYFRYRKV